LYLFDRSGIQEQFEFAFDHALPCLLFGQLKPEVSLFMRKTWECCAKAALLFAFAQPHQAIKTLLGFIFNAKSGHAGGADVDTVGLLGR